MLLKVSTCLVTSVDLSFKLDYKAFRGGATLTSLHLWQAPELKAQEQQLRGSI